MLIFCENIFRILKRNLHGGMIVINVFDCPLPAKVGLLFLSRSRKNVFYECAHQHPKLLSCTSRLAISVNALRHLPNIYTLFHVEYVNDHGT